MEYFFSIFDQIKELGNKYRQLSYYYVGYLQHEVRLPQYGGSGSKKLEAVRLGDLEEIEKKLFSGEWRVDDCVSINSMSTMLHEAIVLDRKEIVSFLLRQGADPNLRDRNGMTPLLKAAALGRDHAVKELIRVGVNPIHIDPYGYTPYELAVLHEEWVTAAMLKDAKSYNKTKTTWFWPPDI